MINISVRQKRLLKIWAINFAISIVSAIAMFVFVSGSLIGLLMLGKIYGTGAVLGAMIIVFMLAGCGALTYAYSKEKLEKMEREEQRTLNALATPYVPKLSLDFEKRMGKYYNMIYGKKNGTKI